MSHEKRKAPSQAANKPAAAAHPASPAPSSKKQDNPPPTSAQVPNLFRRWDWITFGIATLLVLIGYIWTLAPDVTLEDSGELAVASHYAGVPHPPGYPVWTIYTWLFTVLIPISNIAWRVALSSAVAGALSCGLVGLLVSRGSSLLFEGIEEFRGLSREKEKWITMVAGTAAGLLLGFNGFMWSQAVIVEVYTFSVLSLVGVLCFLLELDEKAKEFLVEKGFDPVYGARPMRRAVERFLEDPLAEEILRGKLHDGVVQVTLEGDKLVFTQNAAANTEEAAAS